VTIVVSAPVAGHTSTAASVTAVQDKVTAAVQLPATLTTPSLLSKPRVPRLPQLPFGA
jgi:hypothetical protein